MKQFLTRLAALAVVASGSIAFAQTKMEGMGGMETMMPFMAPMEKMMSAMTGMASTGNADADFLMMMIPHHQSAIEMAKVELETGSDPATKEMAQKIIDAQEAEIAEMKKMIEALGFEPPAN